MITYMRTLISILFLCSTRASSKQAPLPILAELSADELENNMEFWRKDIAVMFYAPWCPHCKSFLPSWSIIAEGVMGENSKSGSVSCVVGKFNCESSTYPDNSKFCASIGIKAYPTFKFFGFGDFHDRKIFSFLNWRRSRKFDSVVEFKGLRYYEAVRDWVKMMMGVSKLQRLQARFMAAIGFKNRLDPAPQLDRLMSHNRVLRKAVLQLLGNSGNENQLHTADTYFDPSLNVDMFTNLSIGGYSDYVLLSCVADKGLEYCDALDEIGRFNEEPFCAVLDSCFETNFSETRCKPKMCPFEDIGCSHVAQCSKANVLEEYSKLFIESK